MAKDHLNPKDLIHLGKIAGQSFKMDDLLSPAIKKQSRQPGKEELKALGRYAVLKHEDGSAKEHTE